jgi:serine phosphatase RsbU (regulator of sigma subunit)
MMMGRRGEREGAVIARHPDSREGPSTVAPAGGSRTREEDDGGARVERGLLATPRISDPGVWVTTGYRPGRSAGAVLGGDFFDAIELADGSIRAVIGDVSGHSADEAALGACLRIAWRTLTLAGSDAEDLLVVLERMLECERHDEDSFATVCVLSVSADRGTLEMRLAGHPLPILVDRGGARLVHGATRAPVGLETRSPWPVTRIEPDGEWSLLLYTDGLIEGHVGAGSERLGADGLVELVTALHPRSQSGGRAAHAAFMERLIGHVTALGGGELSDDVAALWLTVAPGP